MAMKMTHELSTAINTPNTAVADACEDMTPAMRKLHQFWIRQNNALGEKFLDSLRDRGKKLIEAAEKPKEFGSIKTLAVAVKLSEPELYKIRQFAERYTDAEFRELKKLRTPSGATLDWSIIVALLAIPDKGMRETLQKGAARGDWTVAHLEGVIREFLGNRRAGAGRPHVKPQTLLDGAANARAYLADFKKRSDTVWLPMFDIFVELPPEAERMATRQQLQSLADEQEEAIALLQEGRSKALGLLKKLDDHLQSNGHVK